MSTWISNLKNGNSIYSSQWLHFFAKNFQLSSLYRYIIEYWNSYTLSSFFHLANSYSKTTQNLARNTNLLQLNYFVMRATIFSIRKSDLNPARKCPPKLCLRFVSEVSVLNIIIHQKFPNIPDICFHHIWELNCKCAINQKKGREQHSLLMRNSPLVTRGEWKGGRAAVG